MKLIFSRKGFDAQYGGRASPILPDGSMISLPIPSENDIRKLGDLYHEKINLGDLALDLTGKFDRNSLIHFDPDLIENMLPRKPGWRPTLGQSDAALSHLTNQGITRGDIFLFFGWFRHVENYSGRWRYIPNSHDFHTIFGWLQVDDIVKTHEFNSGSYKNYQWLKSHPHIESSILTNKKNDSIFVGKAKLDIGIDASDLSGGGVFSKFSRKLRLTADEKSRSIWELPAWFSPDGRMSTLTYHGNERRWTQKGETTLLQTVAKGQEFVLNCEHYPEAENWIRNLFLPD